jgi:hypothetical protein
MWRGLGPALSGVIPSRAVQFATYSFMKRTLAPLLGENTSLHLVSASVAGTQCRDLARFDHAGLVLTFLLSLSLSLCRVSCAQA